MPKTKSSKSVSKPVAVGSKGNGGLNYMSKENAMQAKDAKAIKADSYKGNRYK